MTLRAFFLKQEEKGRKSEWNSC